MKKSGKVVWIITGILTAIGAVAIESKAQSHEGFIYGKVYTSRAVYTGPIRWGTEEVLWTDIFNADKTEDSYSKLVPSQGSSDSWTDFNWDINSIWENSAGHQFTCQFGNMAEMKMSGSNVVIKLKNGSQIKVEDSGNDIGEKVQIMDPELGIVNLNWETIDRIEFLPTPGTLPEVFGIPLYGTVEGVRNEKYTGFIVWDNDERLTTDKLDGESEDGDVSLMFRDISTITKRGRGSYVQLKSGREVRLTGTNDVDSDNRGIMVVTPDIGVVKFTWESFSKVTFATPKTTGQAYPQFTSPKMMTGTVKLFESKSVTGSIVYDVDEALDFEIIEGTENDIEYLIPMKNIKRIVPKNVDYSQIELRSGQILLLGDGRDVSSRNGGLLVFQKGQKDPVYISWRKVDEIIFD